MEDFFFLPCSFPFMSSEDEIAEQPKLEIEIELKFAIEINTQVDLYGVGLMNNFKQFLFLDCGHRSRDESPSASEPTSHFFFYPRVEF